MMEKVTPNVFTTTRLRGCNPSFVTTSDGVVVIDTPQLPTKAVAMRREAESHGPIRYLINTEHHVDHIFGNYFFKGAGTVVNHRELYDRFVEEKRRAGEKTAPAFDSFRDLIGKQTEKIRSEKGAAAVDFRLETRDGKVSLKARIVK